MKEMDPEVVYAPTSDGWQLALHHWPPKRAMRRHPILMVHGLGANRHNLDPDERHSIARAAWDRGYAVYVLELRGAGLSCPPGGRDRTLFQWGFGEYAERDVPAAMAKVLEHAGARALHGFGHSMGGMLFCAQGVRRPPELRSITAVGSPLISDLQLGSR
ncbi:MAG: alpha/beta fold hydrolase, partial [Deltaproteobacteria bacterium]|nr:alpha/beta fold hydrolase [Deltaproteobacteria bacterium]